MLPLGMVGAHRRLNVGAVQGHPEMRGLPNARKCPINSRILAIVPQRLLLVHLGAASPVVSRGAIPIPTVRPRAGMTCTGVLMGRQTVAWPLYLPHLHTVASVEPSRLTSLGPLPGAFTQALERTPAPRRAQNAGAAMKPFSTTMLNSMADADFETAWDRHVAWGLRHLDLKDSIFDKGVVELSDAVARHAAELIAARGLSVCCMSTQRFYGDVEVGESAFCKAYVEPLERAIEIAAVLWPSLFRLLSARTRRRAQLSDSIAYLRREYP